LAVNSLPQSARPGGVELPGPGASSTKTTKKWILLAISYQTCQSTAFLSETEGRPSSRLSVLGNSEGEATSFSDPLPGSALPMMTSPARGKHVLAFLACLLTAAAGGDDFSLRRLALPLPTPVPEELPEADPNCDFVAAPGPVSPCQRKARGYDGPEGLGRAGALPAPAARCSLLQSTLASRAPRAEQGTRLRC
jgi:hypothetical protein